MTKQERNEMIIALAKNGKTNAEIINQLKTSGVDVSERTIRRVIEEHFGPTTRAKCPSGQNVELDKITREEYEELQDKIDSLLDTIDIQNATISSLKTDIANISKANIQEANIGVLGDGDRYFIYEHDELKYSADTLQNLADKCKFNWRWAEEKLANGMDNLIIGNGSVLRTSLKQNMNGMNKVHMNTDDKINAVVNALMAFCRNSTDTSDLYAEMDRIKRGW